MRNAPITVQNVVTYDTVIGVNNADLKLKPGMTANVSIVIAHKDDVLKISNAALRYRPANAPTPERSASGQNRAGCWWWRVGRSAVDGSHGLCFTREQSRASANQNRISDGTTTEVLEGLAEKRSCDHRATNAPNAATSQQQGNPFGGPRRFP